MPENLSAINYIDVTFLSIMLIFALIGIFRGLIGEIFSSLNWIASFAISFFLTPYIAKLLEPYFKIGILLDISARIGLFFVCFLIFFFSTSELVKKLKDGFSPIFDRPLGFIFGCLKTVAIFGVAFSMYSNIYDFISTSRNTNDRLIAEVPKNEASKIGSEQEKTDKPTDSNKFQIDTRNKYPKSFLEAKCANYIAFSSRVLDPVLKPIYISLIKNYGTEIKNKIFKEIENSVLERLKQQQDLKQAPNSDSEDNSDPKNSNLNGLIKKLNDNVGEVNHEEGGVQEKQDSKNTFPISDSNLNSNSGSNRSGYDNKNGSGYDKNEIAKKERMMEIINQQAK